MMYVRWISSIVLYDICFTITCSVTVGGKEDASSVLLKFVLFLNTVMILITCICKHCRTAIGFGDNIQFKVIPLKLFYYQTFFETWHNQHS